MDIDISKTTAVFDRLVSLPPYRVTCLYGGSSSSKTISVSQYLTGIAQYVPNQVITIIGESMPVLKRSIIRDWRTFVMGESYDDNLFNRSDSLYTFPSGSIIQFVPGDDGSRFHGPRQDYALLDEAYNIPKDVFDMVEIRTRQRIFLTWNPRSEFWAKELEDRDDSIMLHSTYKDNRFLEASIIKSLEGRADRDPNFYRVYVMGEYGNLEGLVFSEGSQWKKVSGFPVDASGKPYYKWRAFGLDFGFTHDPSCLVEIRFVDGELYMKEHLYNTGLVNRDIFDRIKGIVSREPIWADAAEPKSIEELRRLGLNIKAASKPRDSVRFGINILKTYPMNVTKDSLNLIKELRNYSWEKDKKKDVYKDVPIDKFNHAIDATRYGVQKIRAAMTGRYIVS